MKGYKNLWTYLFWMAKTYLRILLDKLASKHSKKMLLLVVPTLLLVGCDHLEPRPYVPPPICMNEDGSRVENSLILEKIPNPGQASLLLQLTNLEMLKHSELYSPTDVLTFIDNVELMLESSPQWTTLFDYVLDETAEFNTTVGDEIILISNHFISLYVDVPISKCDKALLLRHLTKQRKLVHQVMND
jgi:hypothetical protein